MNLFNDSSVDPSHCPITAIALHLFISNPFQNSVHAFTIQKPNQLLNSYVTDYIELLVIPEMIRMVSIHLGISHFPLFSEHVSRALLRGPLGQVL